MSNSAAAGTDAGRFLELLVVLTVSLSGIGLLLVRLGAFDAPPVWIGGLLVTFWYYRATSAAPATSGSAVPAWHLALVVLVGLLFRLTPDAYVLGGQDQGIYVNAAMELARTGGLLPADPVMAGITDPAVLAIYRQANYTPDFLPGIFATADGLQFQFYHLFPVWLALFGDGFGPQMAVYGLTFLSLVSLLFFYRLAQLLTGSATTGLVAGLLLAANPLHAFFSKFPVTEVPTLAFSLMTFSLLLGYYLGADGERRPRLLMLSAAAMACLFLTRISGFMYVPFIAAIAVVAMLFEAHPERRKGILAWSTAILAAYVVSVGYGLLWSERYARDIYRLSFQPLLGPHWRMLVALLAVMGAFGLLLAWWGSRRKVPAAAMKRIITFGVWLLPFVGVAIAALGAYRAYRLGYTDTYAADPWSGQRFGLSHQGVRSLLSTSLVASATYLSPFIFAAFFPAAFIARRNALLSLLLLFATLFFGVVVILQGVLAYQPYFARYLLSELLPYALLLVVCAWGVVQGRQRFVLGLALGLGSVFCAGLGFAQLGKSEHEGVADSLGKLSARFDRGDLVLIDGTMTKPAAHELKTALVFTMGVNVATVTPANLDDADYLHELGAPYDGTYLLTTGAGRIPGFREVDAIRFTERAFRHDEWPPVALVTRNDSRIRVLEWDARTDTSRLRVTFGQRRDGNPMLVAGWSVPEPWGVWSNGKSARIDVDASTLDLARAKAAVMILTGRVYVTPKSPAQRIGVTLAGRTVATAVANYPQGRIEISAPVSPADLRDGGAVVELTLPDAVSPRALGYSGDSRLLAFGIERLEMRLTTEDKATPPPDGRPRD